MPIPAKSLEQTRSRALRYATGWKHEFVTIEHLLLALLEDPNASKILKQCEVDVVKLRIDLTEYLDKDLEGHIGPAHLHPKPTTAFIRAMEGILYTTQYWQTTGQQVLFAVYADSETHASYFLERSGFDREKIISYLEDEECAASLMV